METIRTCNMSLRCPGRPHNPGFWKKAKIIVDYDFFLIEKDFPGKRKFAFILFENHFVFETSNNPASKTEAQNSKAYMPDWCILQVGVSA